MIAAGTPAPPFALPGSDGTDHNLDSYRGRIVVLFFYPRDSTPG